jgi:hypothetical protein
LAVALLIGFRRSQYEYVEETASEGQDSLDAVMSVQQHEECLSECNMSEGEEHIWVDVVDEAEKPVPVSDETV